MNLDYKGSKSTTFQLVLLGFVTGTALIVFGYIDGNQWVTGVLGLLTGYVMRDAVKSFSEAYRDKGTQPPPQP